METCANISIHDCSVIRDREFGGVYLGVSISDFNAIGFSYGDSVDVEFSNGYALANIPYYNGYYERAGRPLLVAYPGNAYIKVALNFGDSLWTAAGLTGAETGSVTLARAGAYRDVQDSFNIAYTFERADYESDAVFANFRALAGGSLRPDTVYRSASLIDDEYGRASYAGALVQQAGVRFALDLSESPRKMDAYIDYARDHGVDVSHYVALRDAGAAVGIALMANYPSLDFAQKLADGFTQMAAHDGPYLVHCVEGKDRTGFVCLVLEALAGATYDEMRADYMATFANYYGITEASDPRKYAAIVRQSLDGMLGFLAQADDDADLRALDYAGPARAYLRRGGMTDAQLDALLARIAV